MTNEFAEIDKLMTAKERVQLELGWSCNDWLAEQRRISRVRDGKAGLSYALDILSDRYYLNGSFSSPEAATANISDWMRVTSYFTRERVAKLRGNFSYHHLRACYHKDPNECERKIAAALKYAAENGGNWPTIEMQRGKKKTQWERAQAACQKIVDDPNESQAHRYAAAWVVNCEGGKKFEDGVEDLSDMMPAAEIFPTKPEDWLIGTNVTSGDPAEMVQ